MESLALLEDRCRRLSLLPLVSCCLVALTAAFAQASEIEPIRWSDGAWDRSGAPKGRLLSDNGRWFGDQFFTGQTNWTVSSEHNAGVTRAVRQYDFKRTCRFTEVDISYELWKGAHGHVEFSADGTTWFGRADYSIAPDKWHARMRLGTEISGRYMRIFVETREGVVPWFFFGVYVWGTCAEENEVGVEGIPLGDSLQFKGAEKGVVSILPMPIPHLAVKPSGKTPDRFPLTMARNETESRYFAVVNGTDRPQTVALRTEGFGEAKAEILFGGVVRVKPPTREMTVLQKIQARVSSDAELNAAFKENLDVMPFFFEGTAPRENFLRRHVANWRQVKGFPSAVPLAPGEGCVVLLRVTTDGAKPGRFGGRLMAGSAALPVDVTVVDLALPPQSMWIYCYEPFTEQLPFESARRVRRDVERYVGLGATTTQWLPEPGTKEHLFFKAVPQASAGVVPEGTYGWLNKSVHKKVMDGKFDELTEAERRIAVDDARRLVERGKELGLAREKVVVFLPDEPTMGNARSIMQLAALLKKEIPEIVLHADPCPFFHKIQDFLDDEGIVKLFQPEYASCIDVSCPVEPIVGGNRTRTLKDLWQHPRLVNSMYNHPAGRTGKGTVYACHRFGFNGFGYYDYYHPVGAPWDIRTWGALNFNYQAVFPLEFDVALTPLYEFLREAAEENRLLDALKAAGKTELYRNLLERSKTAWDRAHFQWDLKDPKAEDILALREDALNAFKR